MITDVLTGGSHVSTTDDMGLFEQLLLPGFRDGQVSRTAM
jgi:hypothetical protein